MKLVTKKSPRGRLFDELSPEQATAVGNVCGKGRVTVNTDRILIHPAKVKLTHPL